MVGAGYSGILVSTVPVRVGSVVAAVFSVVEAVVPIAGRVGRVTDDELLRVFGLVLALVCDVVLAELLLVVCLDVATEVGWLFCARALLKNSDTEMAADRSSDRFNESRDSSMAIVLGAIAHS